MSVFLLFRWGQNIYKYIKSMTYLIVVQWHIVGDHFWDLEGDAHHHE